MSWVACSCNRVSSISSDEGSRQAGAPLVQHLYVSLHAVSLSSSVTLVYISSLSV